jgi:hypothetical protein
LESFLAQIACHAGTSSFEDSRAPTCIDLTKVKRRRGFAIAARGFAHALLDFSQRRAARRALSCAS